MRYSRVGSSGLVVSRVGLGMMSYGSTSRRAWHLDADAALPLVRAAAEAGVTFFDTADMYDQGASEEVTGTLLREVFGSRDDFVLATKVYFPMGDAPTSRGLSRKHLHAAVDASLRRLGTDHIDLYQIHRWDDATPIEETMCALDELVRAGKVRYPGASSMYAWQFAKAQYTARAHGWSGFVSMQNLYNLAYREEEREMIPLCRDLGVGVLPYSPLARGFLTGSRTRGGGRSTVRGRSDPLAEEHYTDDDFTVVDTVAEVARERGVPPAQVALAWLQGRPGVVSPIVGVTRPAHLDDAVAAVELELDDAEVRRLEAPYRPHPVLGHG
ncbi:aldo/keto reductase [Streptomyces sp. NPDC087270]|uniref:aldo/keto reductase n=1 Tax=Streptomyces sp. NPDC087270 TaxID=3365774 RepID=UPI0037F5AD4B